MIERQNRKPRQSGNVRSGAALVEMAAVLVIFTMMLFGILEYCRLVFVKQVIENAAREGARYAVVNTYSNTVVADTQKRVLTLMGGLDKTMVGYSCQVYMADANGNNIGNVVNAPFGAYACCDVSLTYNPITPGLLFLSNSLTLRSKCCMGSEAN